MTMHNPQLPNREVMTDAARKFVGDPVGAHPWHIIDRTIDAILALIPSPDQGEAEAIRPVAWRWRYVHPGKPVQWLHRGTPISAHPASDHCVERIVEPLYATPPVDSAKPGEALLPIRRFRHKVRGTEYDELGTAELQSATPIEEGALLVIYRGDDGKLWARSPGEFHDGRFERVLSASLPEPQLGVER